MKEIVIDCAKRCWRMKVIAYPTTAVLLHLHQSVAWDGVNKSFNGTEWVDLCK